MNLHSTRLWRKFIVKYATKGKTINLEYGHLLSQMELLTTVAKGAIKKGIANPIEMVPMGAYPRNQQESFQNGSPRSL